MAGKVRFYRGAQGTSLPETHQDGAIFIIERAGTNNLGDMYVDMDNGKRLHIIPDSELITYNSTMSGNTSTLGQVYIFQETDDQGNPIKVGIAVGDGNAYIGDLPVYNFSVKNVLQNKVNAYLGTEYMSIEESKRNLDKKGTKKLSDDIIDASETLVLSREL